MSFDAALHFLNFLYTGATEWKEDIFDELVQLATKYEVKDLLYILNNSRETIELFTDEDSTMEVCNESKRNTELLNEGESNEISICFDHAQKKMAPISDDLVVNDLKNTDHIKSCDEHEQSFNLAKQINSKISATCNTHELYNLSSDCINKVQTAKQDSSSSQVIHEEDECIPEELCIVGNKFNHSPSINNNSLFSSPGNEIPVNKMTITFSSESESSNDSCKIVKAEIASPYTPSKIITNKSTNSPISSSSSPRNWLGKNSAPSASCSYDNKLCTPDKYECLCPEATLRNSADIVLVESEDINKKAPNISPVSFESRLPLKRRYKLDGFSETFPDSPFHICDENDDFNSALCLSQNSSLQVSERESCGLNLNVSQTSVIQKKEMNSPSHKLLQMTLNKTPVCEEIDPFAQEVGDKISHHSDFSKQIHTNVDDIYRKEGGPSLEIFICDSDNEVDTILGKNYFEKENNLIEKKNLDYSSSDVIRNQISFSKSNCLSPVKNDANLTRKSVIRNDKCASPEIIYCDSSSNDYEDLAKRIESNKKASDTAYRELSSSSPVLDNVQYGHINKSSGASTENLLLSSPESPWVFRTDKQCNNLLKSACSSQLNTRASSECIPKKKRNMISPEKSQDKNSVCPTTPSSTLAPKFKISDSPITPLPDYNKMKTPEIKEALKRIGVKALPRKKAVAVLSHIYEETHPWNENSSECLENNLESELQSSMKNAGNKKIVSLPKKRKQETEVCDRALKKTQGKYISPPVEVFNKEVKITAKPCCSSQPIKSNKMQMENLVNFSSQATYPSKEKICSSPTGSCDSREDNENNVSFSSELSDNSQPECKESTESIKEYILSNEDLYKRILSYTPLNLAEFQQELKENGMNISVKNLMDYLDEQCITFTCPRKEEYKKKQQVRTQRFRKRMIAKLSQQGS